MRSSLRIFNGSKIAKDITLGEALGLRLTEPSRIPSSVLDPVLIVLSEEPEGVLFEGGLLVYRTIVKENWLFSLGDERDCVAVPDWKVKSFRCVCSCCRLC